jgi:hypothetical protein
MLHIDMEKTKSIWCSLVGDKYRLVVRETIDDSIGRVSVL